VDRSSFHSAVGGPPDLAETDGHIIGAIRSGAFSGLGVSHSTHLTFFFIRVTRANSVWLNAPMRESRRPESGVDTMPSRVSRRRSQTKRRVQQGQGLVEYALIIVLISIAAIAILSTLGSSISVLYSAANVMTAP
jgi:Flp pilus assembly pilin Flp